MTEPSTTVGTPGAAGEVRLQRLPAWGDVALAVHGGAGPRPGPLDDEERRAREDTLTRAVAAGQRVLLAGGAALDAVCESVVVLEDCDLFNAGHGAALTDQGTAELDACVMTGDGSAGGVTVARHAYNPVRAARAVLENTSHALLADPAPAVLEGWGLQVEEPENFVTERARQSLARRLSQHGTVGAVARDRHGRIAAATSTGGLPGQLVGRVGDTPVPGAGNFADDASLAISGTGQGEFFLRGALCHQVSARMRFGGQSLSAAATDAQLELLVDRGADGGLIAVTPAGETVLSYCSSQMYRGWLTDSGPQVWV